ncbi:TetR/AcrR family transcriptional regulator [Ralstonia insidiosa]|uniref:TetR/AcrR family transcriptional regulator n=1 Tax=Ralstonia insidiosa TaxID=190721 RepID=UPI000CEF3019|nr:TetR/AcrR family transcriptional regulator [Ralstonia insidiosa]
MATTAAPRKKRTETPFTPSESAVKSLDAAVRYVLDNGIGDMSLRRVAEAIGTSHRMLIYHFGSADEFWEIVLREIRHREQLARVRVQNDIADPVAAIEAAWDRYASDAYLPIIRLLFELYARAIREPERFHDFLGDVVDSWLAPVAALFEAQLGLAPAEARARARIQVATMRGLLLDLVTTGDRKGTTAALKRFARMITAS